MVDFSTSKPFQSEGKEVRNCIVRGYFKLAKTIPKLVEIKKGTAQEIILAVPFLVKILRGSSSLSQSMNECFVIIHVLF